MAQARPISAIEVLEEDHDYVRKAYRAFQKMDHEGCAALKVHVRSSTIRPRPSSASSSA